MNGPFRGGEVHVLAVKCSTCIFRPGNLMHLQPGRVEELVKQNIEGGGAIVCHQTLNIEHAVCRGFFDVYKNDIPGLTVAERLSMISYDSPPKEVNES